MYRSASIFILLAFLLGLWIGFNPEARARAQVAWKRADAALTDLDARLRVAMDRLFNRVSEASPPPANPPVKPEPSNFLGQLQSFLEQVINAVKQLWINLTSPDRSPRPT